MSKIKVEVYEISVESPFGPGFHVATRVMGLSDMEISVPWLLPAFGYSQVRRTAIAKANFELAERGTAALLGDPSLTPSYQGSSVDGWLIGERLSTREWLAVERREVLLTPSTDDPSRFHTSATGLAAGRTYTDATRRAIFELMERNQARRTWENEGKSLSEIPINGIPSKLLSVIHNNEFRLFLYVITSCRKFQTVVGMIENQKGQVSFGSASGDYLRDSAIRATCEALAVQVNILKLNRGFRFRHPCRTDIGFYHGKEVMAHLKCRVLSNNVGMYSETGRASNFRLAEEAESYLGGQILIFKLPRVLKYVWPQACVVRAYLLPSAKSHPNDRKRSGEQRQLEFHPPCPF